MTDYPELNEYSWGECHLGFMGAGGLFPVSEMGEKLGLKPGMRVLDLCCGHGASSIFLAGHFDLDVSAVDLNIDPAENQKRVDQAGLAGRITFYQYGCAPASISPESL